MPCGYTRRVHLAAPTSRQATILDHALDPKQYFSSPGIFIGARIGKDVRAGGVFGRMGKLKRRVA